MNHAILRGLEKFPEDADLVVGIPRSGLLAGNMISLYLNLPLTDMKGLKAKRLLGNGKRPIRNSSKEIFDKARTIIVVDDCVSKGTEMLKTKKLVEEWGYAGRVVYVSVFCFPERPDIADINLEMIPRPMCFQWSCMHTPEIGHNCVDLDGMLSEWISPEGEAHEYLGKLREAKPVFTPTVEIGCILAARPESSREITETWLAEHRISFKRLELVPDNVFDSPDWRTKVAQLKAAVFGEERYHLYLAGDDEIGDMVAKATGKPVMCMRSSAMLNQSANAEDDITRGQLRWLWVRIRGVPKGILRKIGLLR